MRLRFCAFSLGLLLLASSGLPIQAQSSKDKFTFGEVDLELLKETNVIDQKLEKSGNVYEEPALNEYLSKLTQELLPPETPENVTWKFHVLSDAEVNAFAFPNGSIYIYAGLLAQLENESQLVSVLAHEIIHVRNRHSYQAFRSYRKKSLAVNLIGALDGNAGTLASLIMITSVTGHSRELEREADEEGFKLLLNARHNPREMAGAFKSLLKKYDVDLSFQIPFWRTHPRLEERIKYTEEIIAKDKLEEFSAESLKAEKTRYELLTETVMRRDVKFAVEDGFYRTALAHAQRLVNDHPNSAANITALADAYAGLGPRPTEPTAKELTGGGKREARKMQSRLMLDEATKKLLDAPGGKELQTHNFAKAEEFYLKAIALEESYALAHRGLAELYAKQQLSAKAAIEYRKYVDLQPGASDRLMIMRRIKNLEAEQPVPEGGQKN